MKKIIFLLIILLAACNKTHDYEEVLMRQSKILDLELNEDTTGFLIPLYLYPTDDYSEYERIISIKEMYPDLPIIVIINPHNGPGEYDENYVKLVSDLNKVSITMIGYIHASYGERSLFELESDIAEFRKLYPEIKGFFVDEVDQGNNSSYYKAIKQLAEEDILIGNPGTIVAKEYFDVFDILVISEMRYDDITEDFLSDAEITDTYKMQRSIISYDTDSELQAIWVANHANWIYISQYDVYTKLTKQFEKLSEMVVERNRG